MTAEVIYQGELRTVCTHLASGSQILTDAPVDNQGRGEAFSPTDLVATALASCMMTIMGIKARDLGLDLAGAKAGVRKVMAANPRRIARVEVLFTMPQGRFSERDKHLLEEVALACPVCKSLNLDCEQAVSFQW